MSTIASEMSRDASLLMVMIVIIIASCNYGFLLIQCDKSCVMSIMNNNVVVFLGRAGKLRYIITFAGRDVQ